MKRSSIVIAAPVLAFVLFMHMTVLAGSGQMLADDAVSLELELQEVTKDPKKFKELIGLVQMVLGAFGYGTGPFDGTMDVRTTTALQEYQKHRGMKQSTKLNAATLKSLFDDFDDFRNEIPYLPKFDLLVDFWDKGVVIANGTWIIEQDDMAFPLQTTKIQCSRDSRECIAATAELSGKHGALSSNLETYVVERWDKHEIVTAPKDYPCVRYTMRILKEQKSVTTSRTRTNASCKDVAAELRLRLEDGSKIYQKLNQAREEKVKQIIQAPFFALGDEK